MKRVDGPLIPIEVEMRCKMATVGIPYIHATDLDETH
jgi:hypothetical protein